MLCSDCSAELLRNNLRSPKTPYLVSGPTRPDSTSLLRHLLLSLSGSISQHGAGKFLSGAKIHVDSVLICFCSCLFRRLSAYLLTCLCPQLICKWLECLFRLEGSGSTSRFSISSTWSDTRVREGFQSTSDFSSKSNIM